MTYKCLHGISPAYLSNQLTLKPSRGLRSDDEMLRVVSKSKLVNYGDRTYSYASPVLWNALPVNRRRSRSVEQFKSVL